MAAEAALMDKLTALCKRRGFIYQSSEIYGGIGGFWDYGPMGVELKRNIKDIWWHDMVTNPPDGPDGKEIEMVGLDCSIIMNPKVWEASGHATGFADPMVDCRSCKSRFRADQIFVLEWFYRDVYAHITAPREGPWVNPVLEQLLRQRPNQNDGRAQKEFRKDFHTITSAEGAQVQPAIRKSVSASSVPEAAGLAKLSAREQSYIKSKHQEALLTFVYPFQVFQAAHHALPPCPSCGVDSLTEPRQFNLMFKTHVGALEDASAQAWLRPETAQGIFVNYQNVLDTTRVKVPFGIAQVGKAFRNEINPRNYTFRSREFEQMEIEFFCHADTYQQWYEFWREVRYNWYVNLGLRGERVRLRDHEGDELAHYASACADVEYLFPFSDEFQELEGVAHRGCYDLSQHQKHSGVDLTYFDNDAWERDKDQFPKEQHKEVKNKEPYRFLPHVIEPSAGADRATLAFLCEAYAEDEQPDEKGKLQSRVLMKLHPKLAPIKVAVFPLVKKEGMPDIAQAIYKDVKRHMTAFYDDKGAVGRRYRRQDEIGTPFCVTVDGDTLQDGTVTIRDRDTLAQVRVAKDNVVTWLRDKLAT
ncbi:MAG: glycine--tRNA ligase [Phycisphaerae bacterium]|nr:glycine--tRNA ligase [Phycisphaerae bacterium]